MQAMEMVEIAIANMFSMENRTEQDKQTEQDKTKQNG
jgi:hypothetical protein